MSSENYVYHLKKGVIYAGFFIGLFLPSQKTEDRRQKTDF